MPLTVVRREARHLYARQPRTALAAAAADALFRVQDAEEREIEQARLASGLGKMEFQAIRYLLQAQRDGRPMSPKDLVVMLATSNASVTKIVDQLERSGDLRRVAHATDRRVQVLEPTEAAATKIEQAYATFHAAVVDVFDAVDDAENEVVARVLRRIADALGEGPTDAAAEQPATE